jgi:type VI secretion system protein ImpA
MEGGIEDAVPPDWKSVSTLAIKALTESSKDLEIAAYLIEALCRTQGFAGLRDGFKLVHGLAEQYWDSLYPTPDEEGISTRVAPLTGLNGDEAEGTLIAPINRVPLTDSANLGRLTYSNYLQAVATGKILDSRVKEQRIANGAMHMELFQKAVDETTPAYYRNIFDDLTAALEELTKLSQTFDAKAGSAAPPISAIRTSLENVLAAINDVARAKLAVTATTKKAEVAGEDEGKSSVEANGKPSDDVEGERLPLVRNRDDALNAILQIGDYFRRIEPHSLVPFALEQAVRWARMPLPDLMMELIPEEDSRKALFKQVGIRPPDSSTEEKREEKRKR